MIQRKRINIKISSVVSTTAINLFAFVIIHCILQRMLNDERVHMNTLIPTNGTQQKD